tara:strand:- start:44 stop:1876 length:1833 start_codon:yes stop_codon:yes gene_type:complete
MEKIVIDIDVQTGEGVKDVENLNKSLNKTDETQKKVKKSTDDVAKASKKSSSSSQRNAAAFEAVNKATGGAIRGFRALIKQMWLLVANPIGAVIAALVLGLTALYNAFASTKAGGEQLKQMMAGVSAVIDVLRDRVLKVGEALVKFFSGDFKGAIKAGKESVSGFGAEVAKEFQQAADSVKALQEVTDSMRDLSVTRAKLNRDLIQAKEIIEGSTASYSEKKKAIDEVRIAETKQTDEELANAKKKLDAIILANSLSDSGAEDLEKEAQARIAVINLEAISSGNKTKFNKLAKLANSEELARLKTIADAKKKLIDDEAALEKKTTADKLAVDKKAAADKLAVDAKLIADKKAIRDLEANTEEEKRVLKLEKEKERFDIAIELATEQGLSVEELERSQEESLQLMRDEFAQTDLDRANKVVEDTKALGIQKVADAQAVADAELAIRQANLSNVGAGFALLGQLAGKNKGLQAAALIGENAAGIATNIINTQASNAKLTLQGGLAAPGLIAANQVRMGIGIATSVAATAKGLSALGKGGAPTGSTPPAPSSAPAPIQSQAPAFNVVGASGTNQLASAIGGQSQQPIRTYIVSDDVSTSQQLDRNIITGATIT